MLANGGRFLRVLVLCAAASLVLCEAGLRLWWPQETYVQGPRMVSDPHMGSIYPPNSLYRYHLPQRTVEFRLNEEGLRDETPHPVPKPEGLFRILLVGDSFTYGSANRYDEIWPVILERGLTGKGFAADVVKAGIPNFDTRSEIYMMQRLVPKYRPDLVIMAFLPNDIFTNEPLSSAAVASASIPDPLRFGMALPHLQTAELAERLLLGNDFVYTHTYWMTSRKQYFRAELTAHAARQYALTQDLLTEAARYAGSQGSRFAAASIPQAFQVVATAREFALSGFAADIVDRKMGETARQQGFPWMESLPVLAADYRAHRQELYFREDGHFTPAGNRVFGEWLLGEVLRRYAPGR